MIRFINNFYHEGDRRPKLCTEQYIIWEPKKEWSYAHHAQIIWFKDRYYVMFSSGHQNEDDVGQRIMYTTSMDFCDWEEPKVLVDSQQGTIAEAVLIPGCWYTDGTILTVYFLSFEYENEGLEDGHRKTGNGGRINWKHYQMSSFDGESWTKQEESQNIAGNHTPIRLLSGRLLCPGGIEHTITDDTSGRKGWKAVYCCDTEYPLNETQIERKNMIPGLVEDHKVDLCEASGIQLDDGTIWMMMRSGTAHLWASKSIDNGETWTLPEETQFTDNRTKFVFGRLPNGRYFYVGTPDPFPPRTRHVLCLSLSDNGMEYKQHFLLDDRQYKEQYIGMDKNGIYGYPSVCVKDGYLCIVCSICKEKIVAMRVPCDTL